MNKRDLIPQIRKSWEFAKALGVDEEFSMPIALEASEEFKALSVNPDASYEDLYLAGLGSGQYNFVLRDFSFFQFGIGSVDGVRFAFYPNPFLGADADSLAELNEMRGYVAEGLIEIEEFLHKISEIRRPRHPPLIRYEYSKLQYIEETHPCSHFHVGFHGENRWPVRRYLSASAFSLFIFRIFYLDCWPRGEVISYGRKKLSLDAVLERARTESRVLSEEEFSDSEKRRFHFF